MANKKLRLNTITSLVYEVVTITSGFIVPRLIMGEYGSEVNGLVNSITQFISVISFLELGVGKVVQSSLYKPLAENDFDQVSKVTVSARRFFRRIAQIMLIYIIVLVIAYPSITKSNFSWLYTATLIIAMCISSFAQYYFGIVNRLILTADQRGYVQYTIETIALIINTAACWILIRCGFSIHIVKLTTSTIFLLRPLCLSLIVKRNYRINYSVKYDEEPIKQKWNGMAQHVAYVVLNSTDTIVLTLFGSLSDVSVYSAYNLVVFGVKRLFTSLTNGIEAYLGRLWALGDETKLARAFNLTEWLIHTSVVLVFGCTGFLIVPFISVYTKGISDANYIRPIFSALIVSAHATHCLRLPYNLMIFAAGHYKQTQSNYVIATIVNIVISILAVIFWGLPGVALGTFVSMLFQTVWMAVYNSRNLVIRPIKCFLKQFVVDFLTAILYYSVPLSYSLDTANYLPWFYLALKTFSIFSCISLIVNFITYRDTLFEISNLLISKKKQ